jgi:hypothetical protein
VVPRILFAPGEGDFLFQKFALAIIIAFVIRGRMCSSPNRLAGGMQRPWIVQIHRRNSSIRLFYLLMNVY